MKANPQITVEAKVSIVLQEGELRALAALSKYSTEDILGAIRAKVSSQLVKEHEDHLTVFLDSARSQLPLLVSAIDKARAGFGS